MKLSATKLWVLAVAIVLSCGPKEVPKHPKPVDDRDTQKEELVPGEVRFSFEDKREERKRPKQPKPTPLKRNDPKKDDRLIDPEEFDPMNGELP